MKIPYGISDFKTIKDEDYYYVDKTMYLEKIENVGKTLLYLKPRRFGKTLFTSMMYYYYDIRSKDIFDTLFKDTYVYNNPTPNKNNYYVLRFDFSGMSSNNGTLEDIENKFLNCIKNAIIQFIKYYKLNIELNSEISNAADLLSSFLTEISLNHKIYILIDEYDNFTNAILSSNQDLFRGILGTNGFIKDFYARIKEYCGLGVVDRVFITGVCSISLDSMTSGFNIATNITTDFRFNSMTALTHDEIKNMLIKIPDGEKHFNVMLQNYDGYNFNEESEELVFNPTLTMYYMKDLVEKGKPPIHLLDSNIISNYKQLKNIISIGDYKEILDDIFDNGEIVSSLSVNFDSDIAFNRNDIISLLFYFGYLTIKGTSGEFSYKFVIPNKVIKTVYSSYYLSLYREFNLNMIDEEEYNSIDEIRKMGDIKRFIEYVSTILKKADNRIYINFKEKDLQILMYAILIKYQNINVELEFKSYDKFIDMYIKTPKYNIIAELKYLKKKESDKYDEVKDYAINQIKEYSKVFNKDNLRKYVVIFTGSDYTIDVIK